MGIQGLGEARPARKGTVLTFVVVLMALGHSAKGSGWASSTRAACLRSAEAFLSVAELWPAEKGAGTASALTDALLHAGMSFLVLTLALRESSHFTCRGWCTGLAFSLSPPCPGCAGAAPSPAKAMACPSETRGSQCRGKQVTPGAQHHGMSAGSPRCTL